ncbi:DUF4229 domain-containing protein [Arthrobacter sp. 35W]|uniref:DUF4229 domain-containing protein n=1 Tax=Arthrobacter sp. 35W TaxID=1132441 RepID=UPI00041CAC93
MAFFKYFLIRAAIFVPLFVLFLLLGAGSIMSVVFAALIAFCVSYLFFRKQRDAASDQLRHRFSGNAKPIRSATELSDAEAEDALTADDEAPGTIAASNAARTDDAAAPAAPAATAAGSTTAAPEAAQVPREFLDK